ncbi:MAG: glycoside hydrolase family 99-like domain-containing protein [Bacteroidetes bacterium]|nr:glycoside hydrolase family 99-like domain-containing protein [Bacteroidota bacterium]
MDRFIEFGGYFPFCLSWANETWKGFHHGLTNRNVLIEQLYPGAEDIEKHFYEVLPAFLDKRYITVQGKPLFAILQPLLIPDAKAFIEQWQNLAIKMD